MSRERWLPVDVPSLIPAPLGRNRGPGGLLGFGPVREAAVEQIVGPLREL
jgi:hypothetical protein